MALQLVKKTDSTVAAKPSPQMHSTSRFILHGAQRRREFAQKNARLLLKNMGLSAVKRVV
jgi:hypothetical protein